MKKMRILLIGVIAICLLWTAGWIFAAYQVHTKITDLASTQNGTSLQCEQHFIGGFPFRFDVKCINAQIQKGDTTYKIAQVEVTARIYRPTHIIAFAASPISLTNNFTGSERTLEFESAKASARLSFGLEIERISVETQNLKWLDSVAEEIELGNAQKISAHLVTNESEDKGLKGYVHIDQGNFFDQDILNADFKAELDATQMERNLMRWNYPDVIKHWQQDEGKILIKNINLQSKNLTIDLSGNLFLNETGLLNGQIEATSKGLVERIIEKTFGMLVPTIFGEQQEDGHYKSILTMENGSIRIGDVPLFYLTPLF